MKSLASETFVLLRLDRGEDLLARLIEFCKEKKIHMAAVQGIGALENVELGFFDTLTREYRRERFEGSRELLSLLGNISLVDDEPFAHLHAQLGDSDYQVVGGHLFGAVVSVTAEIFIRPLSAEVTRQTNQDLKLKLWDWE